MCPYRSEYFAHGMPTQTYRLFIVYNRSLWVLVLPTLLLMATAGASADERQSERADVSLYRSIRGGHLCRDAFAHECRCHLHEQPPAVDHFFLQSLSDHQCACNP